MSPRSLARMSGAMCILYVVLLPNLSYANLVRVEGEEKGTGVTRRKGFACFLVTPAHVVGGKGEVKVVGRGGDAATASLPQILNGNDLAILRINGDRALDFCSEPWPDFATVDDSVPWQARYATPNGNDSRVDVLFERGDAVGNVVLKPRTPNDTFFQGLSGGVVYAGPSAVAMIVRIPDVNEKQVSAEAFRWSYLDSITRVYFETGTEWRALPSLGKTVEGLAIFNGRLFAATDLGGVFRYDDFSRRWDDVSGPLAGRALRSLETFGVFLMASSDDYATKRAGWSLMGDDYKWLDMGLTGSVVPAIRADHIYIHYGMYGAYLKGRGTDQPVVNNKGFLGTPYINALEPTDTGVFAGLGPGSGPTNGTGLWFLPKTADHWSAVKGIDEEDIHALTKNVRYVFAGTTTDGVFRVDMDGSHPANVSDGLPSGQVVHKLAARDNRILAGTLGKGVFGSSNNGDHWVDFNDEQTRSARISSLLIADENAVYVGTETGKVFVTSLPVVAEALSTDGTAHYTLGGKPTPGSVTPAGFRVDDSLKLYVNNVYKANASNCLGYGDCTKPVAPVWFDAKPGDTLRIEAYDSGGDYYFDELWIYKEGKPIQQVSPGKPLCSIAERPCPTPAREPEVFFSADFPIP